MTTSPHTATAAKDTQAHAVHLKAWNQIPWLVAGSASTADRAAFLRHAEGCDECRAELDFQRRVQGALQASALPAHSAEPALRRLQARIAVEDSVAPRALPPLRQQPGSGRGTGWVKAWAGVALLQAAGLVLLGSMLWSRGDGGAGNEYRTLTSAPAAAGAQAATIRLVLSPQVSAGQLQALLQRQRLAAVDISADGSSLGLVASDAAATAATTDALIQALRAEPGVLMAEPVAVPAR